MVEFGTFSAFRGPAGPGPVRISVMALVQGAENYNHVTALRAGE